MSRIHAVLASRAGAGSKAAAQALEDLALVRKVLLSLRTAARRMTKSKQRAVKEWGAVVLKEVTAPEPLPPQCPGATCVPVLDMGRGFSCRHCFRPMRNTGFNPPRTNPFEREPR